MHLLIYPKPLCTSKFAKKIGPPTRLSGIFIAVDDFVNPFEQWLASRALPSQSQPTRQSELTASEIITLLVYCGTGYPASLGL